MKATSGKKQYMAPYAEYDMCCNVPGYAANRVYLHAIKCGMPLVDILAVGPQVLNQSVA